MRNTRFIERAFTLVELLVVVGIIALLIAILLPVVTRAREMANRAKCASNARQLSMAWLMYANESKGRFALPLGITINHRPQLFFGWLTNTTAASPDGSRTDLTTGMLWPYLRSKDVYRCPSDLQEELTATSEGYRYIPAGYSYAQNGYLGINSSFFFHGQTLVPPQTFLTLGQIKHSDSTALMMETGSISSGSHYPSASIPYFQKGTLYYSDPFILSVNHKTGSRAAGCTVSFVDGHVIFWSCSGDVLHELHPDQNSTDVLQLAAWSGIGEIPPGVTP